MLLLMNPPLVKWRLEEMSASARRFEIEKKKQAVRRLSQGSKRALSSPQGNEKFSFKKGLSPEELRSRRNKLQQSKHENFQGRLATQRKQPGVNRNTMTQMDKVGQNKSNPYVWEKGDLRKKLGSKGNTQEPLDKRQKSYVKPDENVTSGYVKQRGSFQPAFRGQVSNESISNIQTSASYNPFAAALKSSEYPTGHQSFEMPPSMVAQSLETDQRIKKDNPFGLKVQADRKMDEKKLEAQIHKSNDSPTEISNKSPSLKANIMTGSLGLSQNNPFALALKTKEDNKPIHVNHPQKSVFGLQAITNPNPNPDFGLAQSNPFMAGLKKPEPADIPPIRQSVQFSGLFNQGEQKSDVDLWKRASDNSYSFNEMTATKQGFDSFSIANSTAIQLMNVPDGLNDKEYLRSYYLRFGEIKRVYRHVNTRSAIITFLDHASAANAKENGKVLRDGYEPIQIFWHVSKNKQENETTDDDVVSVLPIAEERKPVGFIEQPVSKPKNNTVFSKMVVEFSTAFANVQARDVNEKAEILEKVDQKIREGMKKETDLKKASLTIGTCPDMCPEKERYLREYQRRLAPFEILSGTENADTHAGQFPAIDHLKAIKEYSRSSADQEEPLPHELRPGHVLKMTMDYLALNVMDSSNGNWAEWYDFVWNRTRGIRKDITQQHLCSEVSVELIEKCARFHIICSHHLCEEDMNVFDPKINNENLTKCLQSLKHMYDDLYVQKGTSCPNEAEFRCYQVLLNLNNTDILREVMEFRQEVRESNDVKFALEVFKSLNSSNYVRFFKLLGVASFLMACIMQRYFNQIRSKGLLLMNRAYGAVNRPVPIPLNDISRLFAIDEEDEISEFCQHYGLTVDDGMVYFSKSSYEEPETSFLPVRSGVIERKRTCTFGEVVNGEPLPSTVDYNPTISFDDHGKYTGKYHELALAGIQLQESDTIPPDADADADADAGSMQPIALRVTKQDVSKVTIDLICSVIAKEVLELATDTVEQAEQAMKIRQEILDDFVSKTISSEIRKMAQEEIESYNNTIIEVSEDLLTEATAPVLRGLASQSLEEERKRQNEEKQMLIFQLATETTRNIIDLNIAHFVREIATEVLREERNREFISAVSDASVLLGREIIEREVSEEVIKISDETVVEEVKRRKENLENLKQKLISARTLRLFRRWIKEFKTRTHIRETLRGLPACSSFRSKGVINYLTRNKTHSANLPEYILLKNGTELSISSVSSLERKRDRHRNAIEKYHRRILSEKHELLKPLDPRPMLNAVASAVKRKPLRRKCFSKILVCFPDHLTDLNDQILNPNILKDKFKMGIDASGQETETGIQCLETLASVTDFSDGVMTNFCVQGLSSSFERDIKEIKNSRELHGVSGIIFITDFKLNSDLWSLERDKLFSILSLKPIEPPCPLLVVALKCSESQDKETLIHRLGLIQLQAKRLCSSYDILEMATEINGAQLNDKLTTSFTTLIKKAPKFPELKTKTLVDFIEEGLELFFYETIYEDGLKRRQVGIRPQDPQASTKLYNGVLDHLIHVCTTDELINLSWPSSNMIMTKSRDYPDLDWNCEESFMKLKNLIKSLKLPDLSDEATPGGSWDDQLQICLDYIQQISDSNRDLSHPSRLICRIEELLNKYKEKWKYRSRSTFLEFPWDSVIEECTIFILTLLQSRLPLSGIDRNSLVSYFEKDYRRFKPAVAWIEAARSFRNETSVLQNSESDFSTFSAHNLSSRDEYIQNSVRETNEHLLKIENSVCSVESPSSEDDVKSILKKFQKKQDLLDASLSSEMLAYSRLNKSTDSCISDICLRNLSVDSYQVAGVKRKREANHSFLDVSESLGFLQRTDSTDSVNKDKKRPKQSIESKIDDLLKEVHYMRSAIKLDEYRFKDILNS